MSPNCDDDIISSNSNQAVGANQLPTECIESQSNVIVSPSLNIYHTTAACLRVPHQLPSTIFTVAIVAMSTTTSIREPYSVTPSDVELTSLDRERNEIVASSEQPTSSANIQELPPVDEGRKAWLFCFSGFMLESLVWGFGFR